MKRRQLVKTTTLGVAAATTASVAACTGASSPVAEGTSEALPRIDWQMATSWPAALDTILGGAQTFADRVSTMSGGRFTISPRSAGEIAPPLEVLNVVSQGAVPCGHTASYYYVGRSPVMGFGSSLPFGLTPQQQNAWLYEGGGLDKLQEFYARQFNVIQFPAGNTGAQMGGWFRREIASVSDLVGLKMRIPGLGGQVMSKLGVTVQTLPGGEIFQALQTGAIDAAEWVGPYDDEKLGLNKVAQYYYYPGWWEPGSTLEVQINLDQWNQLPEIYQRIVRTAAFEANLEMLSRYETRNNEALQRLVDGGVQLREYSAEIMTAAQEATFDLYDEFAANNADFKAIYDDWRGFRDRIYAWSQLNQGAFERFVYSNLKAGGEPPA
ncbi:MAG: TRAP transporter substrate-binding protein [Nodosilinea sp. WJT8-NPBG4]|nr:TRAP transporter substrate-binding protein [Nodosilinea sp. WJT8-NPBG4]